MNEIHIVKAEKAEVAAGAGGGKQKCCFVIMPFSQTTDVHSEKYWTEFYDKFLQPAIGSHGFAVHRSEAKTGKISKDIVQDLAYSDLVFAVLTDNNPNVGMNLEFGIRLDLAQ